MPSSISSSTPPSGFKPEAPVDPKKDATVVEKSDTTTTSPSAPVEVTGTVKDTTERKFEWNVGRLFYHQEGHSQTRTWAVRVLSVLFVLPVVLTALVDLGRGIGYLAGSKSESLGKIFTGKSWSLMDEVSSGCKAVASKVSSVYKSFTTPKTETLEESNQRSEQAMKGQVGKLVDAYKDLNGGYLNTNDSFSSPAALKAEKQIRTAQNELVRLVDEYLTRNVSKTSNFADQLTSIKEKIAGFINETARDEFYVANKVERIGPHPFLRDIVNAEFVNAVAGSKTIANHFIAIAKTDLDVASSLRTGVDQQIITPDQAKQAVQEQAPVVYAQGLESGLGVAANAEKAFLDAAVRNKIVSQDEVSSITAEVRPNIEDLAVAAAKDVTKTKTPKTTDEIVKAQLVKAADQLITDKKLDPKDKSEFVIQAQKQVSAVKNAVDADAQAQKKAQEEADLKAKQESDLREAERAAQVKKAEDQVSLVGKFKDLLGVISKKQTELDAKFQSRDELDVERQRITDLRIKIRGTPVTVKEKEMTVFDASAVYEADVDRISNSKTLTDAEKDKQIKALVTEGYDQKTIDMIHQLGELTPQLQAKIGEMAVVSDKIKTQHEELSKLIATYNVFVKNNKDKLEEANRKEVVGIEKKVFEAQKALNTRHDQLLLRGVIARLRPHAPVVNVDPAGNHAEVDAILNADKNADKQAQRPAPKKLPKKPSFGTQFADGARWAWNKLPSLRSKAPPAPGAAAVAAPVPAPGAAAVPAPGAAPVPAPGAAPAVPPQVA